MTKLYITCGREDAPEGFIKLDPSDGYIPEGPIKEVLGHHILDKIPDLEGFFESLYEAMETGAKATFQQTYYRSPMAFVSPLTVRGVSEFSLSWLSKAWRDANKWVGCNTEVDFDVQYAVSMNPDLETRSDDAKNFAMANYASAVPAVQFIITKK